MKSLKIIFTGICTILLVNWSLSAQQWSGAQNTTGLIHRTGNVGLGTTNPQTYFHIHASPSKPQFRLEDGKGYWQLWGGNNFSIHDRDEIRMIIKKGGNVGLGITNPQTYFHIHASPSKPQFRLEDEKGYWQLWGGNNFSIHDRDEIRMIIKKGGNVGIGTTNPLTELHVNGTTTTDILTITGGNDIAEPFSISEPDMLPPGSVVVIDENDPGKLTLSSAPYDKKVAGVISGANGINPGIVLTQSDGFDNDQNVALVGRVFVRANSMNGIIEPGDFLTTSSISGEAMKVTDYQKAQGAILGKAMSILNKDNGWVLVLLTQ